MKAKPNVMPADVRQGRAEAVSLKGRDDAASDVVRPRRKDITGRRKITKGDQGNGILRDGQCFIFFFFIAAGSPAPGGRFEQTA